MTVRLYADAKGIPLERVAVALMHDKTYATDCAECETKEGKIDRIERVVTLEGDLDDAMRAKLLEIANKCPVHRTLAQRNVDSDAACVRVERAADYCANRSLSAECVVRPVSRQNLPCLRNLVRTPCCPPAR